MTESLFWSRCPRPNLKPGASKSSRSASRFSGRALEKLRVPVVKDAGLELELVAELADRDFIDQVPRQICAFCSGVK